MAYAPSRYLRIIRTIVLFTVLLGLSHLLLIAFASDRYESNVIKSKTIVAEGEEVKEHISELGAEQRYSSLALSSAHNIQEIEAGSTIGRQQFQDQLAAIQYGSRYRDHTLTPANNEDTNSIEEGNDKKNLSADNRQGEFLAREGAPEEESVVYRIKKANGVLVMLAHEVELQRVRETVRHAEDRFNRGRNYPWVILSSIPFTVRSRNLVKQLSKGSITFGLIPHDQWRLPKWIEAAKVRNADYTRKKLGMNKTSLLTRHKWRYTSGYLAQHELLDPYDIFWRIDPGVEIFCDIEEDPMLAMEASGKKLAWSLSSSINEIGVPGAWTIIQKFKETHPELISDSNDESFLMRESKDAFAACTYSVENSIGRVDFFRSPEYKAYFDFIDQEGPIYYEKWNDAAVVTIGLSLLNRRTDITFMKNLGWRLDSSTAPIAYCPQDCPCDPQLNNLPLHLSCTPFWLGQTKSPQMKRRLECNKEAKCVLYVSKTSQNLIS
ncbi:alpha 1,2-mannosyltransferase 2.4.1 [Lobosporangium transversale]|nr:alpha 1,2-mannosyltransferase 2.4.1 [Lobosporangium transversale]